MSLDLRTMRYVIAIAEAGGFGQAAERLHVSQPPLSRQIRELERELGVTLFHRRPTRLTAEGHVFVTHARAVLTAVERAVAETRAAAATVTGVVRVGCGPMSGATDMPALIAAVADRQPGVRLDVVELWDTDLGAALVAGEIDIAVGWHLPGGGGALTSRVLRCDRYVAVVSDAHRFADRKVLSLRDFRGETFRFLPRRYAPHYYDSVLAALRSTGEDFTVWENPMPGLRYYGDRSAGFHMLPASMARSLPAGLRCVPLDDDLPPVEVRIVWRPGAGHAVETVVALALSNTYSIT